MESLFGYRSSEDKTLKGRVKNVRMRIRRKGVISRGAEVGGNEKSIH